MKINNSTSISTNDNSLRGKSKISKKRNAKSHVLQKRNSDHELVSRHAFDVSDWFVYNAIWG